MGGLSSGRSWVEVNGDAGGDGSCRISAPVMFVHDHPADPRHSLGRHVRRDGTAGGAPRGASPARGGPSPTFGQIFQEWDTTAARVAVGETAILLTPPLYRY